MSYAPTRLLELRDYLKKHTGLSDAALGIVGDSSHTHGYHLGKDRTPPGDYSTTSSRDRAGLTNAASASDIGNFPELVELTGWMVAEARAGRRPDTREIIGPGTNGRAYRWARETGWRADIRPNGDSHEFHVHESWFRDSESRDKIQFFKAFFEEYTMDPGGYNASAILRGLCLGHDLVNQKNSAGEPSAQVDVNVMVDRIARRVIELLPPGETPGLTKADVTDAVRVELDKTHLTG
jgi:hypothetical protein